MRLLVSAILAACAPAPGDDPPDTDAPVDTDVPETDDTDDTEVEPETDVVDTESDPEVDTGPASDTDPPSTLSGTVTSTAGAKIGPTVAQVRYCRPAGCLISDQGTDGTWSFPPLPPGIGSIEIVDRDGGAAWATWSVPFRLGSSKDVSFDLTAWLAATPVTLGGTRTDVSPHPDLVVTVRSGDFRSNDGQDAPAGTLVATSVPPADLPVLQGLPGEVVAAWLLGPFDHLHTGAGAAMKVRVPGQDLAGATVWVSAYDQGRWLEVGALAAVPGEDGWWRPSGGIPRLGTLVVVR